MTTEDKRPHWKFVSDFIQQSAHPVTLAQIKEHFKAHGRNTANPQPDATAVSVNESSRVHYGAAERLEGRTLAIGMTSSIEIRIAPTFHIDPPPTVFGKSTRLATVREASEKSRGQAMTGKMKKTAFQRSRTEPLRRMERF